MPAVDEATRLRVLFVLEGLAFGGCPVNAVDLAGASAELADACEREAAGNLKRVLRPVDTDWFADPGTERMTALLETKTVWHPIGV